MESLNGDDDASPKSPTPGVLKTFKVWFKDPSAVGDLTFPVGEPVIHQKQDGRDAPFPLVPELTPEQT